MASPQLWAFVTFALLLSAVTVYSEDVTAQHRSSPTTCPMPCPVGETCSCTCQWKSRNRAAGTSTVGGNWLDIGTTCQVRRPWQTGRCRPGSRCTCACSPAPPVAVSDIFLFEDPEGPDGPGTWPVSVLHNDVSPDGSPLTVVAGSVQVLPSSTPGVSVVGVDAAGGIITLDIPDGAQVVELQYQVQSAGGVSQTAIVQGTGGGQGVPSDYPKGVCSTTCGRAAELCKNSLKRNCTAPGPCHCLTWKKSSTFGASNPYAMYDFRQPCNISAHVGCNRCAIYHIMQQCKANKFAPECVVNDDQSRMVIVKARDFKNGQECLMNKHYLVMPHTPCTGVDSADRSCRGSYVGAWWQRGFKFAIDSKEGFNNPAIMINQPEERGQQHMHIHIAEISTSGPFRLIPADMSTLPKYKPGVSVKPKQYTDGKRQMLVYYVDKSDFPNILSPPHLAKQIHFEQYANSYNDYSFGVAVIPEKTRGKFTGGAAVIAVYGFSDRDALDTSVGSGCQDPCKPIADYP